MIHALAPTVNTAVTEIVTEAASAEIEIGALVIAAALVLAGMLGRRAWTAAIRVALAAAGFALALATIAVAVANNGWLTGLDRPALDWFVAHRTGTLDTVAVAVTTAGGPAETAAAGVLIAALIAWRTRRFGPAVVLLGTVAAASAVCVALKLLIGRERPPRAVELMLEIDPSFPSGHTTGTAALTVMIALVLAAGRSARTRAALLTAAAMITAVVAASRLYLGVHWLTDVVAGLLLAATACVAGWYALHILDARTIDRVAAVSTTEKVAA